MDPELTLPAPDKTLAAPDKTLAAPDKTLAAPDKTLAAPDKTLAAPGLGATLPSRDGATAHSTHPRTAVTAGSPIAAGMQLGRYILLSRLGAGGMGVVWGAYDPELDRKVALKLLHPREGDDHGSLASQRLVREAQAMARLTHPHVITVFDAGVSGARVFVAMEFVEGDTLDGWAASEKAGWSQLLGVMISAGEGLAAAHRAGMIHRDFKPDNVMVTHDGRVLVMDFGLARAGTLNQKGDVEGADDELAQLGITHSSSVDSELTRAGGVSGTPAYMSIEQFEGGEVDARADQFSFCVTFWELLFNERPYQGDSLPQLVRAVSMGERSAAPGDTRVPAWLIRTLERGLATKAEDRWPSMAELLAELREGEKRRRRRRVVAGLSVLGLAVVAAAVGAEVHERQLAAACEDAAATAPRLWADEQGALREAFAQSSASYAQHAGTQVDLRASAWASTWSKVSSESCRAHTFDKHRSEQEYADLKRCLDDGLSHAGIIFEGLRSGDDAAVSQAVELVTTLPDPHRCEDAAYLATLRRPPPEIADDVDALEAELMRASTLSELKREVEALELLGTISERVGATDYAPLQASFDYEWGLAAQRKGSFEDGRKHLRAAYFRGLANGLDSTALAAAGTLINVEATDLGNTDVGREWLAHAEALLERQGGILSDPQSSIAVHAHAAQLLSLSGEHAAAISQLELAEQVARENFGDDHPATARLLNDHANVEFSRGNAEVALEYLQQAKMMMERELGAEHPELIAVYANEAAAQYARGLLPEAAAASKRALAISEATYGTSSAQVVVPLVNHAVFLDADGKALEALVAYEHARDLLMAQGATSQTYSDVLGNLVVSYIDLDRLDDAVSTSDVQRAVLEGADEDNAVQWLFFFNARGNLMRARGDYSLAEELHRKAHARAVEVVGESHDLSAVTRYAAGKDLAMAGRYDAAWADIEAARAVWQELKHPRIGNADQTFGMIELERGHPEKALEHLDAALKAQHTGERPVLEQFETRALRVRALWESGDRPAAREAAIALASELDATQTGVALEREFDAWWAARASG